MDWDLSILFNPDDVTSVARALGVVIPVILTAITKINAPLKIKGAVLAALSGAVAFLAPILAGVGVPDNIFMLINGMLNAMLVGILIQVGILKPTGAADFIAERTANFGIGPKEPAPAPSTPEPPAIDPEPEPEPDAEPEPVGDHEKPPADIVEDYEQPSEPIVDEYPSELDADAEADPADPTDEQLAELDELVSDEPAEGADPQQG